MKMPVPNDWDGSTFCNYLVKWPQSTLWRIILRGLLSNPSLEAFWDATTGDVSQLIEDFQPALDTNLDELGCTNMNIPVGTIWLFAGQDMPDGWILCLGQTLNRDEAPDLFAAIGTQFGAPDANTFKLPDLRQRVPVGWDPGGYGAFDTIGETGGEITHTLTVPEMPSHSHSFAGNAGGTPTFMAITGSWAQTAPYATTSTGGGNAHNNLQPYLVLNYMIRVQA